MAARVVNRCSAALLALFALTSCNKVFGLDEGTLDPYAGGSDSAGAGSQGGAGDGAGITTGAGGEGACLLDAGIENADFEYWTSSDSPDNWTKSTYNASLTLSNPPGSTTGLQMTVTDIGGGAYVGVSQGGSFLEWDQCIEMSGASRKTSGSGSVFARAYFGGLQLVAQLPAGPDYTPWSVRCRPNQLVDTFNLQVRLEQLSDGGTATVHLSDVRMDHVCCDGGEPQCDPEP